MPGRELEQEAPRQRRILLGDVVSPWERWARGAVAIEGTSIHAVGNREDVLGALGDPGRWEIADYADAWLLPGMIDLHIHGGAGADVMMATDDALGTVARVVAEGGASGLLATTRTASRDQLIDAARAVGRVAAAAPGSAAGAQVLGLHLEGPYISPRRAGGQPAAQIRDPDLGEMEIIASACSAHLRMVTFAPERPGGPALTRWLAERNIIPALGHSDATYDEAAAAIRSGVTHFCHAYNAMPPLHHREPGALVAGLLDDRVTLQLIADGIHVHPAALALAFRTKGPDGIVLVTDAAAAGLGPGRFELAGRTVVVDERAVRLPDGTLAGSKLQMNRALQICVEQAGISFADAVRAASTTPARVLGLGARKGTLAPGYDADVTVLGADFSVQAVLALGRFVVGDPRRRA
jgi:N-acetylglucosamine-6-phosphate deacetylase